MIKPQAEYKFWDYSMLVSQLQALCNVQQWDAELGRSGRGLRSNYGWDEFSRRQCGWAIKSRDWNTPQEKKNSKTKAYMTHDLRKLGFNNSMTRRR